MPIGARPYVDQTYLKVFVSELPMPILRVSVKGQNVVADIP